MKKLTTGLMALLLALVLCVSLLPATAQAADAPSVTTWNIALKDNIVVNFKVNVPDVAGTTISATVNGAAVETSQSVSGNTYTVSVPLAAAQLTDSVKLLYNVNGTQSESREYTATEYASYILNGNYDVAVKQIVNQMLTYGAAAQNYFNYNTGALANAGVENIYANITMPTDVPAVSVTDNLEKVTYIGTSLVFRSQVYTRFYFNMDDRNTEINNYTVTINGQDCLYGKFYDPQGRFNYFADSPGITPNNYDQQLKVVITDTRDQSTMTIYYSPLNYIVKKSSSSTANLPELMKAMYGYHVESCEYMNYENAAATTFGSATGYGQNGIAYDGSSNVDLIFALANTNSAPEGKDYYPQSANCIMLKRGDSDPIPVADIEKPAIQKRSADAYHIYAQNLNTQLQDQDILIVADKFSADRHDTYRDGETLNVSTAYVYVDLSYEKTATITSAEPLLWQTVDVGPFYTHAHTYQTHKYLAADPNAAPYYPDWNNPYCSIDSTSLTYVQNGVPTKLDTTGLTIRKYGETDYYFEGGSYDSTVLQNGDYFILEGLFVQRNGEKVAINVLPTYIHKDSDSGKVTIAGKLPTTVNAGVLQTHEAGMDGNGIYFRTAANDAPSNSDWSLEYKQTSADNIKLVRNGETVSIGIADRPLLIKLNECDYYLRLDEWTIGAYGLNSTNPITTEDMLIIEGDFFYVKENVTLNITKSYIYYDGGKWVCSTAAPEVVDVVHLESNPTNGWNSTSYDEPGGMHFTAAENAAPYNTDWSLRYTPTSIDAIKLIRHGVETSIANTGAETIVKYDETKYHMEFWPFAKHKPMLAGDILIIDGWFYNKANNKYIDVEKTYFTLFADGTIACTKEMPVSHTVTLDANGGSCSTTSLSTTTGGKVTLPDATRSGYRFTGWSDGSNAYQAGENYTVNGNVTLTAQWIALYTVIYDANNGSVDRTSDTVDAGSTVTLPTPTREHYTFNGWYTAASGGTKVGDANASYYPTGDVTLYAQWTYNGCFTENAQVKLATGATKAIKDLTHDDIVVSWNFFTGEYNYVPASLISYHGEATTEVVTLNFDNGVSTKIISSHGFFSLDENRFIFLDAENANNYIGTNFADGNGNNAAKLISVDTTFEYTKIYGIISAYHANVVIDGMLTLAPANYNGRTDTDICTYGFEIGEDMKYIGAEESIAEYGLYSYDEFIAMADEDVAEFITPEIFDVLNIQYFKIPISKGQMTLQDLQDAIRQQMITGDAKPK